MPALRIALLSDAWFTAFRADARLQQRPDDRFTVDHALPALNIASMKT